MRRILTLLLAFAISMGMVCITNAYGKSGGGHKGIDKVVKKDKAGKHAFKSHKRERLLGQRFDRRDNYGRRRSALAHRQNAERRALHRQQQAERRFVRARGADRRDLAHRQRDERRLLRGQHRLERKEIRP